MNDQIAYGCDVENIDICQIDIMRGAEIPQAVKNEAGNSVQMFYDAESKTVKINVYKAD